MTSTSRLRLWPTTALIGAIACLSASIALSRPAPPDGAPRRPGAVGDTAGQVPAQTRQAQAVADTAPRGDGYGAADPSWWAPGEQRTMPAMADYADPSGRMQVLNADGPLASKGHPFFTPLGANGRACVTCHQPENGMGLSVATIDRRWAETQGKDPLFAAIDGSNCPSLPQGERASHALLLDRGLFRIFLPWPPRAADGTPIQPEFTIAVVSDPTTCNTDPTYGLHSANPMVSVFRRPRPLANTKYLTQLPHGVPPHEAFFYNDKSLLPKDPQTGQFVSLQLMADGREPTLRTQALEAAMTHLQASRKPTARQLDRIVAFERQIYAAQGVDGVAGALTGNGAPPGLGAASLRDGAPAWLGNNPVNKVFGSFAMWAKPASGESPAQSERRQSIVRGAELYYSRRFIIQDVGAYNDKGIGNPFKRSCASGCHNTLMMGMDLAPGFMDLGLNNLPWSNNRPDLPLFEITCSPTARPQAYLGRHIYTHDPGRALITGKCFDVGATMTQQLRALAGRAPYFANGSARSLRELVDFYDRRFNIGYAEQEKQDLVHFLEVL
ncbi:hypothetical protein [Novosphingobium rosa]|uniref:hypothetical protein n=1 Tax=Novosphingobium rosa TaxID=76978 RepID=UPI00082BD60E|nr:hypothetical protein [Novosphingobium rosa]